MILKNVSQKIDICLDLKVATSFFDNLFGLLQPDKQAMLFYTRFGVHTVSMARKIDVLVLNSKWEVVKMKENLPPNRFFFWDTKFKMVIELPATTIKNTNTKIGDLLIMQNK